jgi:hypothetical protein
MGQDIVIPQGHAWYYTNHLSLNGNGNNGPMRAAPHGNKSQTDDTTPLRSISSTGNTTIPWKSKNIFFRGDTSGEGRDCSPGIRMVVKTLHDNLLPPLQDGFLLQNGEITQAYYALCPAGNACWSMRVYDAIEHEVVPVILADPIIEPFERFLHWPAFTLKWMTHGTTTGVDNGSDSDSSSSNSSNSSNINSNTSTSNGTGSDASASRSSRTVDIGAITTDRNNIANFGDEMIQHLTSESTRARTAAVAGHSMARAVADGLAFARKLQAVRQVAPWLSFECPPHAVRCAYRLVTAEMWCRTHKGRHHPACARTVSAIAYQQYM